MPPLRMRPIVRVLARTQGAEVARNAVPKEQRVCSQSRRLANTRRALKNCLKSEIISYIRTYLVVLVQYVNSVSLEHSNFVLLR